MPSLTIKIGLYTQKEHWQHTDLDGAAPLIAQHICEPTGIYLPLSYQTTSDAYRFQPLWDFDDKQNPIRALEDARNFAESLTKQGIPLEGLMPFASGRKGIHLVSRHLLPPRNDWYEIFAHAAKHRWSEEFPTLDAGIYKNRAMVRAPWSRHSAVNARKKPLSWDLFWTGDWRQISSWAQQPLNDAQWADIESLIRESLPALDPPPTYWTPFSDALVLDFQRHALARKAIAAAMSPRHRLRFLSDWGAILDEAGLDYRERRNKDGRYFKLLKCPYCQRKDKAWVAKSGILRCFRTGCEAHEGISANAWAEYLGVDLSDCFKESEKSEIFRRDGGLRLSAEEASAKLRQELERIHHQKPGTALLVMSTPGIGKTTHALDHIRQFSGDVIVAAATKERARELYEQYNGNDARLLEGRCEQNCQDHNRVSLVSQKGYLPGKTVCPGCPFFPSNAKKEGIPPCAYYQQFKKLPRVLFCTYEQALYLHSAFKLPADLIVLDEDPSRAFMQKLSLQLPHLQFNPEGFELPLRQFTRFLQHTLAIATETEGKSAVYRSRLLVDLLLLSASQLEIDLPKLLSQVKNCMENVYDRPARLAHKEIEQLERIPPAYLQDLAMALSMELSHDAFDWNSPLSIGVKKGVATLQFYQRFILDTDTPLVILDAYGREEYYSALLKRQVETIQVGADIHAKVIRIQLATSKRAFAVRRDALFRRLDEVISHSQDRRILIYTHAAIEEQVKQRYPFVAVQHFWSGRGKDEFKDSDVVIIFGTAEPNPQDLLGECRALYSEDPVPISPDPLPSNPRHRKDGRLEALLSMRREEEMEQACHRLRPVWAEGNPKTIVVMSHLDLPGLEADETIDPRGIEQMNRKELLSQFIADCMDQMGFYCEALAELAGVVSLRSNLLTECRRRLACTASLIENTIRNPVQPGDGADSLYPKNRNAYTTDRNVILCAMELAEEILSFDRGNGKWVSIKVWGDVARAEAFFRALLCDQFAEAEPFDPETLKAVCQSHEVRLTVLFVAPTRTDAYSPLFSDWQSGCRRRNRPNRFDRRCQTGERGQRSAGDEG